VLPFALFCNFLESGGGGGSVMQDASLENDESLLEVDEKKPVVVQC